MKNKMLDVTALADRLHVPDGFLEVGEGRRVPIRAWTPESMIQATKIVHEYIAEDGCLHLCGLAHSWVHGALAAAAAPAKIYYDVPAIGETNQIASLSQGEYRPEGEMTFTVHEVDDKVFLHFMSDNPAKPFDRGPHNYDYSKINNVAVPPVAADKHVFLSGQGAFPVSLSIASAYFARVKSISMMYVSENEYTCIASYCDQRRLGDREPAVTVK